VLNLVFFELEGVEGKESAIFWASFSLEEGFMSAGQHRTKEFRVVDLFQTYDIGSLEEGFKLNRTMTKI